MHVIGMEWQRLKAGRPWRPPAKGEKVCQEEEVVGPVRPRPQTAWDVDLKVSTRFSNKKVRDGRERPALGASGGQSLPEGGER